MELTCKLASLLVVKAYFFYLPGMFIITSPTNTQKDGLHAATVGKCLLRNTSFEQEVEGEEEMGLVGEIWRLCCAKLSPLPVSMLTEHAPQGLLLRAFVIILPATLWAMKQGTPISLQDSTDDLRHRLCGMKRDVEGEDPRETKNKLARNQALFAQPFLHNMCKLIRLRGYLHLDLFQHVIQNMSADLVESSNFECGNCVLGGWDFSCVQ
eukprot:420913-Pelagomonas_calceolata.AAC.2